MTGFCCRLVVVSVRQSFLTKHESMSRVHLMAQNESLRAGERLAFVSQATLEVSYAGMQTLTLDVGDRVSFVSISPHRVIRLHPPF